MLQGKIFFKNNSGIFLVFIAARVYWIVDVINNYYVTIKYKCTL